MIRLALSRRRPRLPGVIAERAEETAERLRAAALEAARAELRLLKRRGVPPDLAAAEAAGWRTWSPRPYGRPHAVALASQAAVAAFQRRGWRRCGTSGLFVLVEPVA